MYVHYKRKLFPKKTTHSNKCLFLSHQKCTEDFKSIFLFFFFIRRSHFAATASVDRGFCEYIIIINSKCSLLFEAKTFSYRLFSQCFTSSHQTWMNNCCFQTFDCVHFGTAHEACSCIVNFLFICIRSQRKCPYVSLVFMFVND